MDENEMFDPFANAIICHCAENRPRAIEKIIPSAFGDEDEPYICGWCTFIRDMGLEASLDAILSGLEEDNEEVNEEYLDENELAMWELEDYGAFSDEGIMPGCHTNVCDEFGPDYLKNCMEYEKMRKFFGEVFKIAREKVGKSAESLAKDVGVPVYVIENLECGEEDIKYDLEKHSCALPVMCITPAQAGEVHTYRERAWWEDEDDEVITEALRKRVLAEKS